MSPDRPWYVRLLVPTWGTFVLASVATLAIVYLKWRTWTVTLGAPDEFVEYYYYWPLFTHSHTDFVRLPPNVTLTWNFFAGFAALYLPAAVVDALLKHAVRTGVRLATDPVRPAIDRASRLTNRLGMRAWRALGTFGFAIVASAIPPLPVSLYSLPGFAAVGFLHAVAPADLLAEVPSEYWLIVVVPAAFPFWYGFFGVVAAAIRFVLARGGQESEYGYPGTR